MANTNTKRVPASLASALVALLLVTSPVASETPYRLTVGDALTVRLVGTEDISVRVDIDGHLRLAEAGAVMVRGLTLDDAEARIGDALTEAGILVSSRVALSLDDYAPVVVSGDVASPGRFAFVPGMTVATAVGLSGGNRLVGVNQLDVDRALVEVEGQLRRANLDIIGSVARIARFQAELDTTAARVVTVSDDLQAVIPIPDAVTLATVVADEQALLENAAERTDSLFALWDNEITALQAQNELLTQRIEVQAEIVEIEAENLANARRLQEGGLQTAVSLSRAEQRDADARASVLELESQKVALLRALVESQQARERYVRGTREEALINLRDARLALETQRLAHRRLLESRAVLLNGNFAVLGASEGLSLEFSIVSSRPDRSVPAPTLDTPLLPGDTLIVRTLVGAPSAAAVIQ